jgi:hypothetical protein
MIGQAVSVVAGADGDEISSGQLSEGDWGTTTSLGGRGERNSVQIDSIGGRGLEATGGRRGACEQEEGLREGLPGVEVSNSNGNTRVDN